MKKLFIAFGFVTTISSCAILENLGQSSGNDAQQPISYLEKAPKFKVKEFLNGELEGFAIIQDELGKIVDSFTTKVSGSWQENRGTVKYNFVFNNGKKDSRTWLITVDDAQNYTAIGHDFASPAKGRQVGNVSKISYILNSIHKDKKAKIKFQDSIYLVDKNSAIVTSLMKIGKDKIGKVTISLKKKKKIKKVVKPEIEPSL